MSLRATKAPGSGKFDIDITPSLEDLNEGILECLEQEAPDTGLDMPKVTIVITSTPPPKDTMSTDQWWAATVYVGGTPDDVMKDLMQVKP